jgi:hypothetical protein
METAIGVILGAIATVLASHYYFRRTVHKSLGIYRLLDSFVFQGIAPDVRASLNFRFNNRDVSELQQLMLLVANDGERAIRDVIEPLRLVIPADVEVLDASIVHRSPEGIRAGVMVEANQPDASLLTLDFPLLNSGEFFVVKMLLSGRLNTGQLEFSILSDDLPRKISISPIPPGAFDAGTFKFEWGLAVAATIVLLFPAWICYVGYQLALLRPELWPFPWSQFSLSWQSAVLLIPASIFVLLFSLLGFMMMGAAVFGGQFPPSRGPKFPLPKEVRSAVFPYRRMYLEPELVEARIEERSNKRVQATREMRAPDA